MSRLNGKDPRNINMWSVPYLLTIGVVATVLSFRMGQLANPFIMSTCRPWLQEKMNLIHSKISHSSLDKFMQPEDAESPARTLSHPASSTKEPSSRQNQKIITQTTPSTPPETNHKHLEDQKIQFPEFKSPRILQGKQFYRRYTPDEEARHYESFYHPALLASPRPRRVAVFGEGDEAWEYIAMHKEVEEGYLLFDSDDDAGYIHPCEFEGDDEDDDEAACILKEDDRFSIYRPDDVIRWFIHLIFDKEEESPSLDVIFLDATYFEFERIYHHLFMEAIWESLGRHGMLIVYNGERPNSFERAKPYLEFNWAVLLDELDLFEHIHDYEVPLETRGMISSFVVATKAYASKGNWYKNEANLAYNILDRMYGPEDDGDWDDDEDFYPFQFLDSATIMTFLYPSRISENLACWNDPIRCERGHGFDPDTPTVPSSKVEVKRSMMGENVGRGLFTIVDIPKQAYITLDEFVHPVFADATTYAVLWSLWSDELFAFTGVDNIMTYLHGYGLTFRYRGYPEIMVDTNVLTFRNHGCNGTYNLGAFTELTEWTADEDFFPPEFDSAYHHWSGYDPFAMRIPVYTSLIQPIREIHAGEEILGNYLTFSGAYSGFKYDLEDLRKQCGGEAGLVEAYQNRKSPQQVSADRKDIIADPLGDEDEDGKNGKKKKGAVDSESTGQKIDEL